MIKRITLGCSALLLLAGCAPKLMPQPEDSDAPVQYVEFNPDMWQTEGKIGFKYPRCSEYRGCKMEAVNAAFLWTHQQNSNQLQLFDPTGQEQISLTYANGRVLVKENGKVQDLSVEKLADRLGIALPVEELSSWLTTKRSEERWEYDGWKVHVSDWQDVYYKKMTLVQNDYRVRLVTYDIRPL